MTTAPEHKLPDDKQSAQKGELMSKQSMTCPNPIIMLKIIYILITKLIRN